MTVSVGLTYIVIPATVPYLRVPVSEIHITLCEMVLASQELDQPFRKAPKRLARRRLLRVHEVLLCVRRGQAAKHVSFVKNCKIIANNVGQRRSHSRRSLPNCLGARHT